MVQLESCSCVHRLGKVFVIQCKVVGEKVSDELGDMYVSKQ